MNKLTDAGTIVSWSASSEVSYQDLLEAMDKAGIDRALAKEMAPRNAFARSCKELQEDRVIDQVEEKKDELTFQFTRKHLDSFKDLQFTKECNLTLNKKTGAVSSSNIELANIAQKLINEHQNKRQPADITRLIQKVFENAGGDLVPIRKQGGCYFVPATHEDLLDKIENMLCTIGGQLDRWVIHKTDAKTNDSIARNMSDHLMTLIKDWKQSIEKLKEECSSDVLIRRLETFQELSRKIKSYQSLLGGFTGALTAELKRGHDALSAKAA